MATKKAVKPKVVKESSDGDDGGKYSLRLYVAGQTPKATRAIENLKKIKKIIGDLSNTERVLVGLDLQPRESVS